MAGYTLEQIVNLPKKDYTKLEFKIFQEYLDEGYNLYCYLGSDNMRGVLYDYFAVVNPENKLQIARYGESNAAFKYLDTLKHGQKIERSRT